MVINCKIRLDSFDRFVYIFNEFFKCFKTVYIIYSVFSRSDFQGVFYILLCIPSLFLMCADGPAFRYQGLPVNIGYIFCVLKVFP